MNALKDLLIHCKTSLQELIATSITSEWVHDNIAYQAGVQARVATLNPLIRANAIKKGMASKMARSGIEIKHLEAAYFRSGDDGVSTILSEKFD